MEQLEEDDPIRIIFEFKIQILSALFLKNGIDYDDYVRAEAKSTQFDQTTFRRAYDEAETEIQGQMLAFEQPQSVP